MSRSDADLVSLSASAAPGTTILVIDSRLNVVERGVGDLHTRLPPGLYKVKFQAGTAVYEQHVALEPGSAGVNVRAPKLEFSSSAPLTDTSLSHEYHRESARRTSREVHVRDGAGSRLFVFARTWSSPGPSDRSVSLPRGHHPATGLVVRDMSGRLVADLAREGRSDLTVPDAWSACTILLDPGPYRLELEVPEVGRIGQVVMASPTWETQVFLLQQDYGDTRNPAYRADLSSGSIMLAREFEGFDPDNEILRLTELAQGALARKRVAVARDLLDKLLDMKFENPMLGLYAAHALLASPDPDRMLLGTVVGRLHDLLGAHPDVDALGLGLGQDPLQAYEVPPMLRVSWEIVVGRAATDRRLVPPGSLASRIAGSIWGDGVWLLWDAETASEIVRAQTPTLDASVQRVVQSILSSDARDLSIADLDDVQQAIVSYATRRSRFRASSDKDLGSEDDSAVTKEDLLGAGPHSVPDLVQYVSEMSAALGLPLSTVEEEAQRLVSMLGLEGAEPTGMPQPEPDEGDPLPS